MRVIARDQGIPQLSSFTVNVTVGVLRNLFPPEFLSTPYVTSLEENAAVNRLVYDVTTRDRDSTVSHVQLFYKHFLNSLPVHLEVFLYDNGFLFYKVFYNTPLFCDTKYSVLSMLFHIAHSFPSVSYTHLTLPTMPDV